MRRNHTAFRKHTLTALLFAALTLAPLSCGDDDNNNDQEPVVGSTAPEAVDLGLPSGTKWANCNMFGRDEYVQWGALNNKSSKDCTWEQYRFGTPDALTKYCFRANYGKDGYTDEAVLGRKLTELEPEDDIARQKWGEGWRIPSKEQWEELINNCKIQRVSANMYASSYYENYRFTGPNGKYIELPHEGYGFQNKIVDDDKCYYWSRTLHDKFDCFAYCFEYISKAKIDYENRAWGMSIRPVKEK